MKFERHCGSAPVSSFVPDGGKKSVTDTSWCDERRFPPGCKQDARVCCCCARISFEVNRPLDPNHFPLRKSVGCLKDGEYNISLTVVIRHRFRDLLQQWMPFVIHPASSSPAQTQIHNRKFCSRGAAPEAIPLIHTHTTVMTLFFSFKYKCLYGSLLFVALPSTRTRLALPTVDRTIEPCNFGWMAEKNKRQTTIDRSLSIAGVGWWWWERDIS